MKEPISTGRKLSWNEEYIIKPIAIFVGKLLAWTIIGLFLFGFTYFIIKLIKFIWFL